MSQNKNNNEHWKVLVLRLKEIADNKGITQLEISERTGMLQSAVSRFFSLKFKPTLETFLQVAQALKVNFFFLSRPSKAISLS